jgi:ferritin-like metal-binding protein YciE
VQTLRDLFEHEIGAAAAFEHGLAQVLEDMADESAKKAVARAFTRQMKQSRKQLARLEKVGERFHRIPGAAPSAALAGILREKEDFVGTAPADELLDYYNLRVADRLAEYGAAVYEGLVETALRLELRHISHLLRANLEEKRVARSALRTLTHGYQVTLQETGGVLQPVPQGDRPQPEALVEG